MVPQGTVSQKTQISIELLLNGVKSLMSKVTTVNPNYKDAIDWKTLLTTIVENLHAVSHFKHEKFDALQYATDFGTISKESLKRITKWGAKYFTHPSSYYPVPQTGMSFKDVRFMTPLPPDELFKGEEQTMKDWLEKYRPVRQRTARSETTKDKAGALPPAAYKKQMTNLTNKQIHWQRALQTAQKENTDRILFTITFYPTTTQLNLSFQKNFKLLQNDSDWFYLFATSTYFIKTRQTRKQLFGQNFISNQWPTWT